MRIGAVAWLVIAILLVGGPVGAVQPGVYLAIGDGITSGSSPTIGDPWPPRLDRLLGSGKTVINKGKAASRVGYGSSKINGWLVQYDPGFLLILYGTNDLGVDYSADYIVGELRKIVRAAKAYGTVPVLGTLPPFFISGVGGQSTLNSRIRQLASAEGIACADVSAAFNNRRSLIMDDGLHPTPEGQELIARTFYNAIPPSYYLTLDAAARAVAHTAQTRSFTVSANVSWTASSSAPWLTITAGAAGSGDGAITYGVAVNAGAARNGTITVSGGGINRTVTLSQSAPGDAADLGMAVDAPALTWSTDGHAPWFVQALSSYDGGSAAQSGAVARSEQSWMQTSVTGPGVISFWWRSAGAGTQDRLRFLIGTAEQQRLTAQVPWQRRSFPVPAGAQILKWQFDKTNSAVLHDTDCGWVDQVQWRADGGYGVVYRFWSPGRKTHFFTQSQDERNLIMAQWPDAWHYEGLAWYAHPAATPGASPIHRFYSPANGTHFFTISEAEKDMIIATWPDIWTYEGIAWYAYPAPAPGTSPIHRFYSPVNRTHFFTVSEVEKDYIIATWPDIWTYEGIAYHANTSPVEPLVEPARQTAPEISMAHTAFAALAPDCQDLSPADAAREPTPVRATVAGRTFFPLAHANAYVTAAVYDATAAEWDQVLPPAWAPEGIFINAPVPGRRYWLAVLIHDDETQTWSLEHGSWLGRLTAPPAREPAPILDEAPAALGLPVETIALPDAADPLSVGLYCPMEQRNVLMLTGLAAGSRIEVTLPAWNRWYRLEVRAANGELLAAAWLGHLRTH
ncbi:MAG: hypothetical protein K9N49_04175 [Candidatus Marinimicrobia bacterium]|nr:hypothetical protein [Candidatus Neomarinimicrobiota bacterium]